MSVPRGEDFFVSILKNRSILEKELADPESYYNQVVKNNPIYDIIIKAMIECYNTGIIDATNSIILDYSRFGIDKSNVMKLLHLNHKYDNKELEKSIDGVSDPSDPIIMSDNSGLQLETQISDGVS